MPLIIVRDDITKMDVDAIVNPSNSLLKEGGGACGAIFAAAGASELQKACNEIGYCHTGQAVITPGFSLPAENIIHTVGPIWKGGSFNEADLLALCYENSLKLAAERGLLSIAFPIISAGIFGYPRLQALDIAFSAITAFLKKSSINVYLVVFDGPMKIIADSLYDYLDHYLKDHIGGSNLGKSSDAGLLAEKTDKKEDFIKCFRKLLFDSGLPEKTLCKRANLKNAPILKIIKTAGFRLHKRLVLALAVALALNLCETENLLESGGFDSARKSKPGLVVKYFIETGDFDIHKINRVLFSFGETQFGPDSLEY